MQIFKILFFLEYGDKNLIRIILKETNQLTETGYTWESFCHFHKGVYFCDFLFVFLHTRSLVKMGLLSKEGIDTFSEKK